MPRWRRWSINAAFDEAAPSRVTAPLFEPNERELAKAELDWSRNRTLGHAGDLLGVALIAGQPRRARAAARFVINAGSRASKAARSLAKITQDDLRNAPAAAQPPEVEQSTRQERIRNLRKSIRRRPFNPLAYMDLAREYVILGHPRSAVRPVEIALALASTSRFVRRSAARFFLHYGDRDRAHDVLRRADNLLQDPWLLAAEIAVAGADRRTSKFVRQARSMLSSRRFHSFHISELAGALATLEFHAGKGSRTRKLLRTSLEHPTENAVAQAAWVSRRIEKFDLSPRVFDTPRPFEARAWQNVGNSDWQQAIDAATLWLRDEPFSSRPASFGSWLAIETTGDYEKAEYFGRHGLRTHPGDFLLANNLAVALASMDRVAEALKEFGRFRIEQIEEQNRAVFLATSGLIQYRLGLPQQGRELYEQAVSAATKRNALTQVATALLHLAREEARYHPDRTEGILAKASEALERLLVKDRAIPECLLRQMPSH